MKKKILFLTLLLSELVVMGCSFTPHSFFQEKTIPQTGQQEESGSFSDNQLSSGEQETSLSGSYQETGHLQVSEEAKKEAVDSWIPEGYTGAIAVITEANSGDVVIQTGDQLLYRNEVYGFQILLGEETQGIGIKINKNIMTRYNKIISPEILGLPNWEEFVSKDIPGYSSFLGIEIKNKEEYQNTTGEGLFLPDAKEEQAINTIGKNNKYYFIICGVANIDHKELNEEILPNLKCKNTEDGSYQGKDCGNRIERTLSSRFSTFDI